MPVIELYTEKSGVDLNGGCRFGHASGNLIPGETMPASKTLFAQVIDFLPWTTFTRIVTRHRGDHRIRTLSCAEQFRCMAFAQLTYRESRRDIEACLTAQSAKLYHMGFRKPVSRSTLADANERRDCF